MFHGNFWSNLEMSWSTSGLEEHDTRISDPEQLHRITDPDWMIGLQAILKADATQ